MKRLILLLFIISIYNLSAQEARYIDSKDLAVIITTEVNYNEGSITLNWAENELATSYEVRKKAMGWNSFGNAIATIQSGTTTYTDPDVKEGVLYEYEVRAISQGKVNLQGQSPVVGFIGFGYTTAGINVDEHLNEQTVLLCIDTTVYEPLKPEIDRLIEDLVSEGWGVRTELVPRAETFSSEAVQATKSVIAKHYENEETNLSTVFLIGRVAVPYSGNIVPDGHTNNHEGAWPADMYYGSMNESLWTDNSTVSAAPGRARNENEPGDGKFDQGSFPNANPVDIAVGRVDFYDMPAFEDNEIQLLKKYLDKDHAFRNGLIEYENKALIDDNFAARNYIEGFASSGWRNYGNWVGSENIAKEDWFTTLGESSYIGAYGTGGGSFTSAGGIGNTDNFAANQVKGIFTMLFGSYFGDWDHRNNLLRAALASEPSILTTAWSARPHWYFHHMNIGMPIGYSTKLSQNNYTTYIPNYYNINNGIIYATGMNSIHVALLGDPTLSMFPTSEMEVTEELTLTKVSPNTVDITWKMPDTDIVHYFDVFRATNEFGPYERINETQITENTFSDTYDYDGDVWYMVREKMPYQSTGGAFWKHIRGQRASVTLADISNVRYVSNKFDIKAGPNPAISNVEINFTLPNSGKTKLEIISSTGSTIRVNLDKTLFSGTHTVNWDLSDSYGNKVSPGVYFIRLISGEHAEVRKITVVR